MDKIRRFDKYTVAVSLLVLVSAGYTLLQISSRLLSTGFQDMTQVYMRVGLGTIIAILLFRKKLSLKHIRATPIRDRLILLCMGTVGFSIGVYFITVGVLNAKLVNTSVIFASVPFFSYIYAFFFLKKPIDVKLVLLLCLSLVGIAIVGSKSIIPRLDTFGIGEFYTLLAAATMAVFYVGRKMLSDHLNNSEITITVMIIAAVSGFIIAQLKGETFQLSVFSDPLVILGLAIGAGMNIVANFAETYAFKHLDAVIGSQILLLENIFSLIAGYFLYHEIISLPEIIGASIVIGSVILANRILPKE